MQKQDNLQLTNPSLFAKIKGNLGSVCSFLFSSLLCQEIFCPIHGGSYYVNISLFFAAIVLLCFSIVDVRRVILAIKNILPIYWILVICIFASYINSLFYIQSFSDFSVVLKGTAVYIAESGLIITVSYLFKDKMRQMMNGLLFGIIVNLLISLLVYFLHLNTGYILSFYDLFPRDAFYIPNGGNVMFQGLFLEPSQLTNALLPAYFAAFGFYKDRLHRIVLFFSMFVIFLFAGSGNVLVFLIGHLIALLFSLRQAKEKFTQIRKEKITISLFFSALILLVAFITCMLIVPSTRHLILSALESINPFGSGNAVRLNHMLAALEMFLKNPWGIGFNLTSLIMTRSFTGINVGTAFNLILARFVELGAVGGFIYFLVFAQPAFILLRKNKRKRHLYLAIALIVSILLQFLNGRIYLTHYLVLGIAFIAVSYCNIEKYKIKI